MIGKFINFLNQSKRIMYMFYKPKKDEYMQILKVTGIGVILIGVIGLLLYFVADFIGLS